MMKSFENLSAREVLALAIQVEKENVRRFRAFSASFRGYDEEVARRFEELAVIEEEHEAKLSAKYYQRFGDDILKIETQGVEAIVESPDLDDGEHHIFASLNPQRVYELALQAEEEAQAFYRSVIPTTSDQDLAELYKELAAEENDHASWLQEKLLSETSEY